MLAGELITQLKDSKNWTDEFLAEHDSEIVGAWNQIRNVLTPLGLYAAFDRAYSERKRPGQVAMMAAVEESDNSREFRDFRSDDRNGIFENIEYFERKNRNKISTFPVSAFPTVIAEYVTDLSDSLQVSEDMVSVCVLGIISLCVQGTFYIQPKPGWIEPLNLYTVTIAKPSERKTPVLKEASEPVYKFVDEENQRRKPEYDKYIVEKNILTKKYNSMMEAASKPFGKNKMNVSVDDVMEVKAQLSNLEEEAVTMLKLIVDDVTTEALVRVLQENEERISVVSAEGGIFGTMAGRYSNQPNIDIFLKGYSGEPYDSERMTRKGESLKKPLITIVLLVQPKVINDAMQSDEFRDRGLLARFLYSIPDSKVGSRVYEPRPVDPKKKEAYFNLVNELLSISSGGFKPESNLIRLDEEAFLLSKNFFDEIEKHLASDFEDIEDWAGKLHGQTMRIAGILHCIEHGISASVIPVNCKTMFNAISIGRYFLDHAMTVFQMSGIGIPKAEKDAKYILKRIKEMLSQNTQNTLKLNFRDLHQSCRGHFEAREDMQPALKELEERNYIKIITEKSGGRGRPKEFIFINPQYLQSEEIEGKIDNE